MYDLETVAFETVDHVSLLCQGLLAVNQLAEMVCAFLKRVSQISPLASHCWRQSDDC